MRDFIEKALADAMKHLQEIAPLQKPRHRFESLEDVTPASLSQYMQQNNIPESATFGTYEEEGHFGNAYASISWIEHQPMTDADTLEFIKRRFSTTASKRVFDLLTVNGYKRVGFNSGLLKAFDDTNVYDMYMKKDFDRLVAYYSLPFIPNPS